MKIVMIMLQDLSYQLVRKDQFGKTLFHFVVVPKEKAEKMEYELIQKGDQDSFYGSANWNI